MVQDRVGDSDIGSSRGDLILRSTNRALAKINRGELANVTRQRRVGYIFQKQTDSFTYDSGTLAYSFTTLGITEADFKFPWDIRINTDENVAFDYLEPTNFRYKRGALSSRTPAFALDNDAAARQLLVYYGADNTLDLEWYSNYMVTDGTTRRATVTDVENDYFLMGDEFVESPLADLTAAYVLRAISTNENKEAASLWNDGENGLMSMMESNNAVYEKKPNTKIKLRSEWNLSYSRISKR